jgi:hypothetical protein
MTKRERRKQNSRGLIIEPKSDSPFRSEPFTRDSSHHKSGFALVQDAFRKRCGMGRRFVPGKKNDADEAA